MRLCIVWGCERGYNNRPTRKQRVIGKKLGAGQGAETANDGAPVKSGPPPEARREGKTAKFVPAAVAADETGSPPAFEFGHKRGHRGFQGHRQFADHLD
jgi:hypothetical protein